MIERIPRVSLRNIARRKSAQAASIRPGASVTSPITAASWPSVLQAAQKRGGLARGHGGEEAAGGLRVEEEVGARPRRGFEDAQHRGAVRRREGGGDAGDRQRLRAGQEGDGGQIQPGAGARGGADVGQMAGEAEAGHVGHRAGAAEEARGLALGAEHHLVALGHVAAPRRPAHLGGEEGAGAEGLGQDQRVAGAGAGEGDRRFRKAGDGEARGHLGAHGGVAADDGRALGGEGLRGGGQHLAQRLGLHRLAHAGQGERGQGGLGRRAHGPDVAHGVDGGDAGEEPGILGEGAQVVGGEDLGAPADAEHRGVVAGQGLHVRARGWRQGFERAGEGAAADLGAAAAAEGGGRHRLGDAGGGVAGDGRRGHRRQIRELLHEAPVDAVLEAPQERAAAGGKARAVGRRPLGAHGDELEVVPLRPVLLSAAVPQGGAEVVEEDRGGADGVGAGLGAGIVREAGAVAGGEDHRVGGGGQIRADVEKAVGGGQAGGGDPGPGAGAGDADREGRGDRAAVLEDDGTRADLGDAASLDQLDAEPAHRGAQAAGGGGADLAQRRGGLDRADGGAGAEGVGHGHGELAAADAAADHRDVAGGIIPKGAPAGGEGAERLGGDGVRGEAGQVRHGRSDADIEREGVEGDGGAALDRDAPGGEVDAGGGCDDEARAGVAGEAHEVDLERLAPVVAGDVAGQHPGVGGDGPRVDQGEAGAGQRVHAPAAQHQRVGVAAAEEDEVSGEGDLVHRGRR